MSLWCALAVKYVTVVCSSCGMSLLCALAVNISLWCALAVEYVTVVCSSCGICHCGVL